LSGAAKYGNPSTIITMPTTHRKNFIEPESYSEDGVYYWIVQIFYL